MKGARHPAIGGYFGLELPENSELHPCAIGYQSARSAFFAVLVTGKPARLWAPWFICDSMLDAARAARVPIERYSIDDSCAISEDIPLEPTDWLLYVNYFGLSQANVRYCLGRYPGVQVVVDNAQALYAVPGDCAAAIYSPRKFVGAPDGGYLYTSLPVHQPGVFDSGSVDRCRHLLRRLVDEPEEGYADFLWAEESLRDVKPQAMSPLTRAMLRSIDYQRVQRRRIQNFRQLHDALGALNAFPCDFDVQSAPLCYPFLHRRSDLRGLLISQRIYIPTYWPEVASGATGAPPLERSLAQFLLPLPCDQRYSEADMARIIDVILSSV